MSDDLKLQNTSLPQNNSAVSKNTALDNLSFKGNPNAVDTTPTADTYQSVPQMPTDIPPVPGKVACAVPAAVGLYGASKLFDKACGGEYEKSLVGRLGKLGDKIATSKIGNNRIVNGLKTRMGNLKPRIQAFIDRHPALSAMQKTPTEPENAMVKGFCEKTSTVELNEASKELVDFVEKPAKSLKELGATADEIRDLKTKYGTNIFGKIKNEKAAIQELQLKKMVTPEKMAQIERYTDRLTRRAAKLEAELATPLSDAMRAKKLKQLDIVRQLQETNLSRQLKRAKMSTLGLDRSSLAAIKANPVANASALESALGKAAPHAKKLSQVANKIKSATAPTTRLGKFLPKAAKVGMRGLTFGGGIFNSILVAAFMATGLQSLFAAPKKQKVSTGVNAIFDAMSWVITLPIAVATMYGVGGLKNIGTTKAGREAYKSALKAFNADVAAGKLTNKVSYCRRLVELRRLNAPAATLTKGQKFLQKVGKVMGVGLENVAPYKAATEGLKGAAKSKAIMGNITRKIPNALKNCAGYPLRFLLYMFAFQPIIDKVFKGVTSAIFGKPYDIEAEQEKNEKIMEERAALYDGPRVLPSEEAKQGLDSVNVHDLSDYNLVKQEVLGVKPANTSNYAPAPNTQYPAQNPYNSPNNNPQDINKSQYDTVERHYVPKLDLSNPVPYGDPMDDPNNPHNRKACQNLVDSSRELINRIEG